MAFRFYLDGQLTDEPTNDTDLNSTIKRDRQLNNLLITQDVELEWNGNNNPPIGAISGYSYLKNLFDNSACNEAELEIYDELNDNSTVLFFSGVIKIPSIKFDYQKIILKTKVQDKSFYAYINNNKTLEVDLTAQLTKTQYALNPITKYSLDLFNQQTCIYGSTVGAYYEAYLVYDIFKLIIKAISDNKVSFESDFLENMDPKPFLCKGQDLINSYTIYPNAQKPIIKISFEKLFMEMRKLYNVFFWIETDSLGNAVLKLETFDTSFSDGIAYFFNDIKEMEVSIDSQSLYGKVNVGSNRQTSGNFDNGISYYGWSKEEFFPLGQCNIDSELDLVNDYIIDTNSIQDCIVGSSTELIDDILIIECSNVDEINKTAIGYQYELANDGNCWYNLGINNYNKVQRYNNQFLTTFGNFNGLGGYGFQASLGNNPISFSNNILYGNVVTITPYNYLTNPASQVPPIWTLYPLVIFPDETTPPNYDDGGNYDNTTGRYYLPIDGIYNFKFDATYYIVNCDNRGLNLDSYFFKLKFKINLFDSATNLKYSNEIIAPYNKFSGLHTDSSTFVITGVAGDYVSCAYEIALYYNTPTLYPNDIPILNINLSTFSTLATPDYVGGGGAGNNNANKYIYDFEYDIPQSDYLALLNNVTRKIQFEKDGINRIGWIDNIKRNDWNGKSQIKIITSNAAYSQ